MVSGRVRAGEESLQKTALREVAEEGGIAANIIQKVETIHYFYTFPGRGRISKFVTFYLMEYMSDLPEGFDGETSEISWVAYDKAYKMLKSSSEKQVLKKAKDLLAS